MRPTMFRILGAALVAALALSPACIPPAEAPAEDDQPQHGQHLVHLRRVCLVRCHGQRDQQSQVGLNVTVVESGAALDNLRKLKEGAFDFALSIDIPSAMQMVQGIDSFKGQPWQDVRVLFIRNVTIDRVDAAQGRRGEDLRRCLGGKKFPRASRAPRRRPT